MTSITLSTSAYIAYLKQPRHAPRTEIQRNFMAVPFRGEDACRTVNLILLTRLGIPSHIIHLILKYLRCANLPIEHWVRLPSTDLQYAEGFLTISNPPLHVSMKNHSHFYINDGKIFTWDGRLVERFENELYLEWYETDPKGSASALSTYMQIEYHEVPPQVYRR